MKGIYQYTNLDTNDVIYIGKDSHIDRKNRYHAHKSQSKRNAQPINRVIQKNLDKYEYSVICEYPTLTDDELNYLECIEIMKHKFLYGAIPKLNFDVGGEGNTGFKHSNESKQLMSKNHSKYWGGKELSTNHRMNQSCAHNSTGYFRVGKQKDNTCSQGFVWVYRWRENGKTKKISRVNIESLKKEVINRGLEWSKLYS